MTELNQELMDKVLRKKLEKALEEPENVEAFKDAMTAVDKSTEVCKTVEAADEEKKNRIRQIAIDIGKTLLVGVVVPVGLEILKMANRQKAIEEINDFERDGTYTTTPGRSLSGLFKW